MTLYAVLRELQLVLAVIAGACPLCTPLTLARLAASADLTKLLLGLCHPSPPRPKAASTRQVHRERPWVCAAFDRPATGLPAHGLPPDGI